MSRRGARQTKSSDGVPNRKGGSWPNHSAMRYELPIPFSPGADNVTDAYRDGWERTFGRKGSDTVNVVTAPTLTPPCPTCGEAGTFHKLEPGRWLCEMELDS